MKHKTHIKRISIFYSLSSFFLSGFIFQNKDLSAGENLPILPVTVEDNEGKFYPASFLSSIYERSPFTVDCPQFLINIKYHHRCELKPIAIEKISKFSNSNTLTIQNPANQEIYTLLSGFIPKPNLGENEIDALKILCDPNDNSTLRNILNVDDSNANDSNELLFPETIIQLTQNLEKYLSFLRENLSDSNTFPVLQFYREHTNNLASIFAFISLRDNEKTKLNFFKEKIMEIETACKKQTEGARFYHFNDFFHTEMLLLFAIENDIFVSDFNFGALKGTGNIHMCSFNEMCPKCEGLFGRYLSSRPGQRFFVSYINQQSNQKTRTFTQNTQIIEPLGNFFKFDISSEPSSLKKLNRLPCKVNPPLKQPSPHKK